MDEQQEHAPQSLLPTLMSRLGLNTIHTPIEPTPLNRRIATLQQHASLETLLQALDDEDESVRAVAVRELEQWGTQVPLHSLIACLHDSSWLVREAAVLTLGALGIFDVLNDGNEFVRDASLLVQQDSFKLSNFSATLRNTRTRLFSALTTLDNLLLRTGMVAGSEGRSMNSQGAMSNDELETRRATKKRQRRTMLGVTGGVLAVLVVAAAVFSWVASTQKFSSTSTSQKQSLGAPLLTTTNQMRNPQIQWSPDSRYLIESDPYNLPDATLVDIGTKAQMQRDVFGIVAEQSLSGNGVGVVPETHWTANGQYLVNESVDTSTGQVTVEVWNVVARQKMLTISYQDKTAIHVANNGTNNFSNEPNPPPAVVSPDNSSLALGKSDGTIEIWNILTGSKSATYKSDTSAIQAIQWSSHSQELFLSQSTSGVVQVWNTAHNKLLLFHAPLVKLQNYMQDASGNIVTKQVTVPAYMDLSSDGRRVVAATDANTVQLWDASTGRPMATYHVQTLYGLEAAYWLQDDTHIAFTSSNIASSNSTKPREIQVLDASTGHTVLSAQVSSNGGYYFSPTEKYLATESTDQKSMSVWDVATGREISTYHNATTLNANAVWSPDERYIATMSKNMFKKSQNNVVQVWNARTGRVVASYSSHSNQVNNVQWSPNGKYLATVSDADTGNIFEVWQAPH